MGPVFLNSVARTAGMVLVMAFAPMAGRLVGSAAHHAGKAARRAGVHACNSIVKLSKRTQRAAVTVGSKLEE